MTNRYRNRDHSLNSSLNALLLLCVIKQLENICGDNDNDGGDLGWLAEAENCVVLSCVYRL